MKLPYANVYITDVYIFIYCLYTKPQNMSLVKITQCLTFVITPEISPRIQKVVLKNFKIGT